MRVSRRIMEEIAVRNLWRVSWSLRLSDKGELRKSQRTYQLGLRSHFPLQRIPPNNCNSPGTKTSTKERLIIIRFFKG